MVFPCTYTCFPRSGSSKTEQPTDLYTDLLKIYLFLLTLAYNLSTAKLQHCSLGKNSCIMQQILVVKVSGNWRNGVSVTKILPTQNRDAEYQFYPFSFMI